MLFKQGRLSKYCCQNGYQQLSGRKEKACSWGDRVNGWLPRNNKRIWQWSKCCKHLLSICDTSGLCSAWISSFCLLSTGLLLCHSVPKGSLVPPMLSRLVCSSLILHFTLLRGHHRSMLPYFNDCKKYGKRELLSLSQEADSCPQRNYKCSCVLAAAHFCWCCLSLSRLQTIKWV